MQAERHFASSGEAVASGKVAINRPARRTETPPLSQKRTSEKNFLGACVSRRKASI